LDSIGMVAAVMSRSDPGTEAVSFGSGQAGPRSRSIWRRISSIARLSWSVSGGSSAYFIARPPLRAVDRALLAAMREPSARPRRGIGGCDVRGGCNVGQPRRPTDHVTFTMYFVLGRTSWDR